MDFVLTLMSSDKPLTPGHFAGVQRYLDSQGLTIGDPVWLAEHKAADLPVSDCLRHDQMEMLWDALAADKIDILCTRTAHRRKKLLLADMDSTIVTTETLDELAVHAGVGEKVAGITARAMNGELDFESALKERVALLEGLPAETLEETYAATQISPGAEAFVKTMASNGATCVLVSGGFTFFTEKIAARAGFHHNHGNILSIANDKLTGRVHEPILGKDAKLEFLHSYTQKQGIDLRDTIAIGDGANDLPMLQAAGLGVAYRPRPVLRDSMNNCLFYSDLSALLYAQGFEKAEFLQA